MDIQKALDMRAEDTPWNEIAEELGVPLHVLRYNCDLAAIKRRHYGGVPEEIKAEVREMRAAGVSWASIETRTGYSWKHLSKVCKVEL